MRVVLILFNALFLRCGLAAVYNTAYSDPHCAPWRTAITHLFEWKWEDIAKECERFLAPQGFCGVQISPPNENRVVTSPNRPWWERYQPVSYKLVTRGGDDAALRDMVARCNAVGVRIYADVVINHMTGFGFSGYGTGGSYFDSSQESFPAVPYSGWDFNGPMQCSTHDLNIHDYHDVNQVRNCRLLSLVDLQLQKEYVRDKVAEYLNELIDMGMAGFRVDAAKHMWPGDMGSILGRTIDLRVDVFGEGKRAFIFSEVIDLGGEPIKDTDYTHLGRVTNFKFGMELSRVFRKQNAMKWLENWGEDWGMMNRGDALVFIDNHDNQRGHGGGGSVLTHWEPRPYKMATAFMMAHPYGFPRIMSSFEYNRADSDQGPPQNADNSIKDVIVNPDLTCGNDWSCEHRWRQIYNMVGFRNSAGFTGVDNWWSGADYQIAFSRGDSGFIALNLENFDINQNLQTGMPAGTYCDVISGNLEDGYCSGRSITVGFDGTAHIHVGHTWEDPMIAIHAGAKLNSAASRLD